MERYFKISESELLELIERDIKYGHLECAGVDNWDSGGVVSEIFEENCKEAGFPEPAEGYYEGYYWEEYTYEDLARYYLKDYPEVEP